MPWGMVGERSLVREAGGVLSPSLKTSAKKNDLRCRFTRDVGRNSSYVEKSEHLVHITYVARCEL